MQIKRIKLSGFKSFVEPTELRIEPGLTGVVGPNGCGKSNVLEAIRWVMGESSPKSMRGAGMDDVIFAGTATRAARDFAEVSLLVERSADDVPGDTRFAGGGEVEVTRRIERGAGSAYRLNGRDVRAKDVALLFADAATGAHSPALVSQGRISAVIAARPTERRMMLEEAAGIAGLHARRKDAEQKLRATDANLVRLDELLGDMEQRAAALRRQAKAAERYRRLSDQIRVAEARLIFARWREAAEAAEAARAEAERAVALVGAAGQAQQEAATAQEQAARVVAVHRRDALCARERASELGHRLGALRSERASVDRRIAELAGRRTRLVADRVREAALEGDAAAALARLDEEMRAIGSRLTAAEAARGTIDIRTVESEDAAREAEAALGKARADQAGEVAEARVTLAALEEARGRLARARAEAERLRGQMDALEDAEPLVGARRAARLAREEATAALARAGEMLAAAELDRQAAATARDAAESRSASTGAELAAIEAEARALLKTVKSAGSGDRLVNRLQVAPGYERAVAAALGEDLDGSVDDQSGPRRWTSPGDSAGDPPLPRELSPLAPHVDAPALLARRLAQIGLAESQGDEVVLAPGQRLVTRDGKMRRWDGFVARGQGAAAAERLIRVNRLAEIKSALPAAAAAVEAARAEAAAAAARIDAARIDAGTARAAETAAAAAIREAGRQEDAANVAIERLDLRRSGLAERVAQAEADLAATVAAHARAEALAAALPDAAATEARVAELRERAGCAQAALAEIRAEAATHARSVGADKQRALAAAAERKDWEARSVAATARQADIAEQVAQTEAEAEGLADTPAALAAQVDALEEEARAAAESAEAAAAHERAAEDSLRVADRALADAGEALSVAREARAGAVARFENQESRRIEMGRISGERFQCPPPLLPERLGFDAAAIQLAPAESEALDRLSQDRERIGPVNLVAERELAELEESRAGSQAEREELGLAINRLRGSIGSLNREGRARLLAAFESVDRHFRSLFTTLFNGGQAHLELVESDDPLEAGLEIMAQPPGKRLSTLTLLSGGEQALTAIALIFGLFLTNPAPICVLDEVDAPLDDANIDRFCDLLDRMTAETDTRYLIVTHNAVTMSRMHRLFGVTMIEQGISRLVSVDLGGAETLLAAE